MDQRTRERLPVLPALIAWVEAERTRTAGLLAAAERTAPGELFTAAGQTLRRTVMKTETTGRIWAEPADGGRRRNLSFDEHRGFWTWAMVEVLRHTGIRIEELTELSHHSLIQYRLPDTGQLIRYCRSPRPRPTPNGCWSSHPSSPTCCRPSSPGSARGGRACRWWSPTTRTNASTTHPCRCCSSGADGWRTERSPRPRCAATLTTR
jgi:hypothetical protein